MRETELTGTLRYADGYWLLADIEKHAETPARLAGTGVYLKVPDVWKTELPRFEDKKVTITGCPSDTALGVLIDVRWIKTTK